MTARTLLAAAVLGVSSLMFGAPGASAGEQEALDAAIRWAGPIMGDACDFSQATAENPRAASRSFAIRYRDKGQDQDSPDAVFPLYQLICGQRAGQADMIFLTRTNGRFMLLSFAEPKPAFDYADEDFTTLVAPPRVAGYRTTSHLMDAVYDPATRIISMLARWRPLGDAWSAGQWRFEDGGFVLTRYAIDPTFDRHAADPWATGAAAGSAYRLYP